MKFLLNTKQNKNRVQYEDINMKTTITVKGTHCNACKMLIEEVCSEMSEVKSCSVDFKTGKTVIEHGGKLDLKKLKKEIEALGEYKVHTE